MFSFSPMQSSSTHFLETIISTISKMSYAWIIRFNFKILVSIIFVTDNVNTKNMLQGSIIQFEHKMIYAVCATLMIVVLYFYFRRFYILHF